MLGEMQREAPLIGAYIECRSACIFCCGSVVEALVEKGSGLLPRACVVVEMQAIDGEDGGQLRRVGTAGVEGCRRSRGQLFEFANLWVGPLDDGGGL